MTIREIKQYIDIYFIAHNAFLDNLYQSKDIINILETNESWVILIFTSIFHRFNYYYVIAECLIFTGYRRRLPGINLH